MSIARTSATVGLIMLSAAPAVKPWTPKTPLLKGDMIVRYVAPSVPADRKIHEEHDGWVALWGRAIAIMTSSGSSTVLRGLG